MTKVLLYSGGIDSWLIDKIWKPDIKIYVDIHGSYSEIEKKYLSSDIIIIDFPLLGQYERDDKYVPLRNLFFLMLASNYGDEICLGATAGDTKRDSNINFLYKAENFLNFLLYEDNKQIKIEKKFAIMSKEQILQEALNQNVTIEEVYNNTFSCYTPIGNKPCYNCQPCLRRFSLLYTNGYNYSQEEKRKIWNYIKNNSIKYYGPEDKNIQQTIIKLKQEFNNN